MINKQIGNETEEELVKKLREEGKTIYSISRINAFNQCQFQYFNTYVKRDRGVSNVYGEIGTFIHESIEKAYRDGEVDKLKLNQELHMKMLELDFLGIEFPSESIQESFTKDIDHFTKNFNMIDGNFILEKMFVTKIKDTYFLLGYIDAIQEDNEGKLNIIDWKTSSKFGGSKLKDAGRQLLVYKLGLEQTTDMKINSIKWAMVKYINVCWVQKNGKTKKKMVNRGKIIKEMYKAFEKDLLSSGMDDIEVGMTLLTALESNDFNALPSIIADKYWLEDCFVEYDDSKEAIEEMENYIVNTIEEIHSKHIDDEDEWLPVDFEKEGTFFCNTLCSHRMTCSFVKEYNAKNRYKKSLY